MKVLFIVLISFFSLPLFAKHMVKDVPLESGGLFQVVVEIPAGTNQKWEADKKDGQIRHSVKNGKKRIVKYLAYPFNYGFFPQTLLNKSEGGDGDPLDVVVLGPALERGKIVKVRVLGVLGMKDDDEHDDKLIAVLDSSEIFRGVNTLKQLNDRFLGITEIMHLFFDHYKGPGEMDSLGWKDEVAAKRLIRRAAKSFKKKNT